MPHGEDYIPRHDADFDVFFKRVVQMATTECAGPNPNWDHVPLRYVTGLQDAFIAWHDAYAKTLNPHTSQDVKEKNRLLKEKKPILREFCQRFLKYEPVTDQQRNDLGIFNKDGEWGMGNGE